MRIERKEYLEQLIRKKTERYGQSDNRYQAIREVISAERDLS